MIDGNRKKQRDKAKRKRYRDNCKRKKRRVSNIGEIMTLASGQGDTSGGAITIDGGVGVSINEESQIVV